MGNYLDKLNPEQRKAVQHINGPLMVIAGAGSGKTRVLTYRIVHLLKNNVSPFNILSLTFTNKAAKEMRNRIETMVGKNISMKHLAVRKLSHSGTVDELLERHNINSKAYLEGYKKLK